MRLLKNKITRSDAATRVQNWIRYAIQKFDLAEEKVPKAIFIPRQDLEDALTEFDRFNKRDQKASGVRIYLTKNTGDSDDLRITCIVVPTVMTNLISKTTGRPVHKDAIITIPAVPRSVGAALAMAPTPPDGGGEGEETIYDITSPCPTDCEGTTPWPPTP